MFIQKAGKRVVYLDHIATTPVAQEVIDAMLPYFREYFGTPTSLHSFGQVAKNVVLFTTIGTNKVGHIFYNTING